MDNKLDLSALQKAISVFGQSCNLWEEMAPTIKNKALLDTLRAGVIQTFEFTYELCWKFMKRWIEMNVNSEGIDGVSRRELFRVSAECGMIDDLPLWMEFHAARNKSSHIYDEDIAEEVLQAAVKFQECAADFLNRLEKKL
ncbi:MAG: nucleotidyltransferase substrate binding protein [Peptococcaceae bacterium]|jgi:nucleotidyltransferase substrate binding protein (TIGR01987 family)|nr:nucleotidyltransferase substrate binding protein [Peptococcaceae bacterium]